jgi:chromosome segregation ATPase
MLVSFSHMSLRETRSPVENLRQPNERASAERLRGAQEALAATQADLENIQTAVANLATMEADIKRTGTIPDGYHAYKQEILDLQDQTDKLIEEQAHLKKELATLKEAQSVETSLDALDTTVTALRSQIEFGRTLNVEGPIQRVQDVLDTLAGHPDYDPEGEFHERAAQILDDLYDIADRNTLRRRAA